MIVNWQFERAQNGMYAEEHPHTIDRKTGKLEIMAVNIICTYHRPVSKQWKSVFLQFGIALRAFRGGWSEMEVQMYFWLWGWPQDSRLGARLHRRTLPRPNHWSVCLHHSGTSGMVGGGFLMPRCQSEWRKQALQLCKIACFEGPFHIEGECKPISGDLAWRISSVCSVLLRQSPNVFIEKRFPEKGSEIECLVFFKYATFGWLTLPKQGKWECGGFKYVLLFNHIWDDDPQLLSKSLTFPGLKQPTS